MLLTTCSKQNNELTKASYFKFPPLHSHRKPQKVRSFSFLIRSRERFMSLTIKPHCDSNNCSDQGYFKISEIKIFVPVYQSNTFLGYFLFKRVISIRDLVPQTIADYNKFRWNTDQTTFYMKRLFWGISLEKHYFLKIMIKVSIWRIMVLQLWPNLRVGL